MNEKYTWDANGNMTRDRNKGIYSVSYNVLNLPQEILFSDGHIIRYKYAADGRKLRAEYVLSNIHVIWDDDIPVVPLDPAGGAPLSPRRGGGGEALPLETTLMTRDYCGNHVYRDSVLERITNDYGYWADGLWYYHIKDYQGNVRAVIDQLGTLKEVNNYYPYGALMGGGTVGNNASVQPYKYGTKELDRQNGLDWYDSQARMYDPLTDRTPTMDPQSEKYYSISPYTWCSGNPILFVDPTGMTLHIIGANAFDALQMLTERFEGAGLHLVMDETGNVSYKTQEGKKLSKEAKRLMEIIDDESIRVHVSATENTNTSNGNLYVGGAFMGNTYNAEDGTVDAYQEVNTEVFQKAEELTKDPGQLLMHEITEAYEGGVISQKNRSSADFVLAKDESKVYKEAHKKATKQPAIYEFWFDSLGRQTKSIENAKRAIWVVRKYGQIKVIQTLK